MGCGAGPDLGVDDDPDQALCYHVQYTGQALRVEVDLPPGVGRDWVAPDWASGAVSAEVETDAAPCELRVDADGRLVLPPHARILRYTYPVEEVARERGWFRGGAGAPGGHVLGGGSYLLRPAQIPLREPVWIYPGAQAVLPWEAGQDGVVRVRGADLLRAGFHTYGGRQTTLNSPQGRLELTVLPGRPPERDAELVAWIRQAWEELLTCAPRYPARRLAVTLVPVRGRGIRFGQLLRSWPPTVAIYVGRRAGPAEFAKDWVAVHELSHSLAPEFRPEVEWLSEGLATYFQILARLRSGRLTPTQSWGQLAWGVRTGRREAGGDSLAYLSSHLQQTHSYRAVYWGGAALLLDLDLAIRRASQGTGSLDQALANLSARGPRATLEDFAAQVDAVAGAPVYQEVAQRHLQGPALAQAPALLARLGVAEGQPPRDDAPWASQRQALEH